MAYDTGVGAAMPARVGLFGKLPDRGDFVRRDLPNSFVDAWDTWLQHGMAASRAALGEGWLDAWLCAPVWRFALPAGMFGSDGWTGVMMPSVDRAGRYFPLTLAAAVPAGVPAPALLAGSWIDAVESVALSALNEGCNYDDFAGAVAGLPPFPPLRAENWHEGWRARTTSGDPDALLFALGAASGAAIGARCLFVTRGGGRVAPAAWVLPHLPPHRAFIGLIDDLESGGVQMGAMPMAAGMAVPMAIGGAAAVTSVAIADTELGHAASLFGSDYATDGGPVVSDEPPGGAFDQLFGELAPEPQAATPDAFGQPPPAQGTMPAPPPVSPSWASTMPEGETLPAAQPAALWQTPAGQLATAEAPAMVESDVATPVQPAPSWIAAADEPPFAASEMPASTAKSVGAADEPPVSAQSAIAADAPGEHERDVTPSPKDLFGDVADDVPPAPSGGLFDHKDGRGSPS